MIHFDVDCYHAFLMLIEHKDDFENPFLHIFAVDQVLVLVNSRRDKNMRFQCHCHQSLRELLFADLILVVV